jgi:hypothetical protein
VRLRLYLFAVNPEGANADMNERYKPYAVAGGLFLLAVIGRFVVWLAFRHDDSKQTVVGVVVEVLIAITMTIAAYRWVCRFPMPRALGDLGLIWALGCLSTVLISPLAGGTYPFASGAGDFFQGIWLYAAIGGGGGVIGIIAAIAAGQDYRSQALKQYAKAADARPHRSVRR